MHQPMLRMLARPTTLIDGFTAKEQIAATAFLIAPVNYYSVLYYYVRPARRSKAKNRPPDSRGRFS